MPLTSRSRPSWLERILDPTSPRSVLLTRLAVGGIFLSEGIQKFLFPAALGPGRFLKIGFPYPGFLAMFVGCVEITCGLLVILGLASRVAAVPLLIDIIVAIVATKVPLLVHDGFWKMAHEARTDYAMLLGSLLVIVSGSGPISIDDWIWKQRRRVPVQVVAVH